MCRRRPWEYGPLNVGQVNELEQMAPFRDRAYPGVCHLAHRGQEPSIGQNVDQATATALMTLRPHSRQAGEIR